MTDNRNIRSLLSSPVLSIFFLERHLLQVQYPFNSTSSVVSSEPKLSQFQLPCFFFRLLDFLFIYMDSGLRTSIKPVFIILNCRRLNLYLRSFSIKKFHFWIGLQVIMLFQISCEARFNFLYILNLYISIFQIYAY